MVLPPLPLHRRQRRRRGREFVFEDLGNAIRKIRIDLGIPIEIEQHRDLPRARRKEAGDNPKYCAVGRSTTTDVDGRDAPSTASCLHQAGLLRHDEPQDVYNYARPPTLPARVDRRPVLQRVAVRELPHARKPRLLEEIPDVGKATTIAELIDRVKAYADA